MYKQTFPIKVSRIRMASLQELKSRKWKYFSRTSWRDEMRFFVEEKRARKFDRLNSARALEEKMNFKCIRVRKSTSLTLSCPPR